MTREEKIEFLSRYKEIDEEITRLCEEQSVWRLRATKITPTYSDMPRGGQQDDAIQSAIEKIIALELEINAEINELQMARAEIILAVRSVDDRLFRQLLALRYLDRRGDYTWEKIAEKMKYTYRHVTRMHGLALDELHIESCP